MTACHLNNIQERANQMPQWPEDHVRLTMYGALAVITIIWAVVVLYSRFRSQETPFQARPPDLDKPRFARADGGGTGFAIEKPGGKITQSTLLNVDAADFIQSGSLQASNGHQLLHTATGPSPRPSLSHIAHFDIITS